MEAIFEVKIGRVQVKGWRTWKTKELDHAAKMWNLMMRDKFKASMLYHNNDLQQVKQQQTIMEKVHFKSWNSGIPSW